MESKHGSDCIADSRQTDTAVDATALALAQERVRNGRIVAMVRLGALASALAVERSFALADLAFIGPRLPVFLVWMALEPWSSSWPDARRRSPAAAGSPCRSWTCRFCT